MPSRGWRGKGEHRNKVESSCGCSKRTTSRTIGAIMKTITASEARMNLYKLLDETAVTSEPVQITGKRADAVLVSMDDWRAIQETLYLRSIPGMRASIRKGLATPVKECLESLDW